ncbi:hypothetical protein ACFL5V_10620 [Fibrobacterota bacterium]
MPQIEHISGIDSLTFFPRRNFRLTFFENVDNFCISFFLKVGSWQAVLPGLLFLRVIYLSLFQGKNFRFPGLS